MPREILIINPNTSQSMTRSIEQSANKYKLPDTNLTCVNVSEGPEVIETYLEDDISAFSLIKKIIEEQDHYDAFVIAASPDPGLFAAREITRKPVVGIGQSPLLLTPILGRKFSILGHWSADKARSETKVKKYKLSGLMASVRVRGISPLNIHEDHTHHLEKMIELGRLAIEEDRAEVLILAGAAFAGMQETISQQLNVPVLEGISCAVKLAEVLVDLCKVGKEQQEWLC